MPIIKVGFSRVWGGLLLGLGCVCLLLALVAGANLIGPMISGAVSIVAGLSMLSRTYFELGGGVLVIHAMIGPATKRYPYSSLADFRFEGNKLFLGAQKIGVAKSQADARDWLAFVEHLRRA
jgi:hypothetical protein